MSANLNVTNGAARKRILLIAANPATSQTTGWPVGFWWAELTHPYWAFTEAGYEVEIRSPRGGALQADSFSDPEDQSGYSAHDILQPFFAYQATRTLTVTLQSETTANWEADEGRWTIPINVVFSKLSSFGVFPASYQLGVGGFVEHPDTGPSWKVRGAIVILLPRRQ